MCRKSEDANEKGDENENKDEENNENKNEGNNKGNNEKNIEEKNIEESEESEGKDEERCDKCKKRCKRQKLSTGDPEMDDRWPQDYILGTRIIGRYAPVLLDVIEDPDNPGHLITTGGSYGGLRIDLDLVQRVIERVREVLPGAQLYIKEEWF